MVSICFSSLGIPFVAGAMVAIATGPRWRSRIYVVAVPVVLYVLWWLGWGHEASNNASLENVADAPLYVFDSIASAISSLLGLGTPRDEVSVDPYDWGRVLAVAAIGLAGWRLVRLGSVPRWLWVVGGDRLLLLAALGDQPDPRSRTELEPLSVHRRDLRDPDRRRAPARGPAAARRRSPSPR